MMPSLRFRGLTVAKLPNVPLRLFSIRDSVDRGANVDSFCAAEGVFNAHGPSGVVLSIGPDKSSSVKAFSSPGCIVTGCDGVELPPSAETVKARLAGLRGDVLRRMAGLVIFALGGYGTARGDC